MQKLAGAYTCDTAGTAYYKVFLQAEDSLDGMAHEGTEANHGIRTVPIPAAQHKWTKWITLQLDSLLDYGLAGRRCLDCDEIELREIPPGGDPAPKSILGLKKGKQSLTVKWAKAGAIQKKIIDGFQVSYSTRKDFSSAKTKTVKKKTASSMKIRKLQKNKTYYVKLRTFRTVDGVRYSSPWSKTRSVKTR